DLFTFAAASAPTVVSLGTSSGSTGGGTLVVINGTNFTAATQVMFGSVAASFTFVSSIEIDAVSPSQTAGTVDVVVATTAGASATSSSDHFTFSAASAPSVNGVTANTGSTTGGDTVTIWGANFSGATDVSFAGVSSSWFTVVSDNTITALSPPGTAGTVDIT